MRWLTLLIAAVIPLSAQTFQLLRSQSGPSGKVVGSKLVIEEVRSRFVYPQDKSFVVYFEWEGPTGDHTLTGYWKNPQGGVAEISPDVHLQTNDKQFGCYWQYTLRPGMPNGVWTLEVRIDGRPAGSHSFEVVSPEASRTAAPEAAALTVEQIYRRAMPSLVWVHKLDGGGRRVDTSSGFVFAPKRIATAFQSIDSADRLEIEFADGRRVTTDRIAACSRIQDWALVEAETGSVAPLERGSPVDLKIGERGLTFNVEGERVRTIGGVDISGKQLDPIFGPRISFSPGLVAEVAGSPLLTPTGGVAAVIGGTRTQGARVFGLSLRYSGVTTLRAQTESVPIGVLEEKPGIESGTLAELLARGTLTIPVTEVQELVYGGTTRNLPADMRASMGPDSTEFSSRDAQVFVYSLWQRKAKLSKGMLGGVVYNVLNRPTIKILPKKMSFVAEAPTRVAASFSPQSLKPGMYRVGPGVR